MSSPYYFQTQEEKYHHLMKLKLKRTKNSWHQWKTVPSKLVMFNKELWKAAGEEQMVYFSLPSYVP